jgi:hypothetical protein
MQNMNLTVYGLNVANILEDIINSANIMANSKLNPTDSASTLKAADKKVYNDLMKAMGEDIKETLDCLITQCEEGHKATAKESAKLVMLAGKMLGEKEDCTALMSKYDIEEADSDKGKMYSYLPIGIAFRTLNSLEGIEIEYERRLKENSEFIAYASPVRKIGLAASRVALQSAVTSSQEYQNVIVGYIKEYRNAMDRYDEHNEVDFSVYCKLLNKINDIIDAWREGLPKDSALDKRPQAQPEV